MNLCFLIEDAYFGSLEFIVLVNKYTGYTRESDFGRCLLYNNTGF